MGIDAEMFVRVKGKPTPAQLREWHYQFGSAFHEHLWAFGTYENKVPEELYLYPVDVWEQDGDDIVPEDGETFLRLRPCSRYYGDGYERGNIVILKAMAEFLELMIPGGEVWYGGDSSGVCAERFGVKERDELFRHFVKHQHAPYLNYGMRTETPQRPTCPYCNYETNQYGFGGGGKYAAFSCLGCGWQSIRNGDKIQEGWKIKDHD